MSRGKIPHCKYCTKPILDKTQAIKKGNYWYHLDCNKKLELEKKSKNSDKDKLLSYINELYSGNIPKYIYVQLAKFRKEYKMKDLGMLLTLKYAFEIKEMQFDESKGIGIIPFLYDECCNNWKREREIKKAVNEFEFDDKEVIVNKRFDNKKIKYKPINMEEL